MEWGMPVDLSLVGRKLWCSNFVQVFDYSISKGVDHCLKYETYSALSVKVSLYPFSYK